MPVAEGCGSTGVSSKRRACLSYNYGKNAPQDLLAEKSGEIMGRRVRLAAVVGLRIR